MLPGPASSRAPPTPAHQASQPGSVDGGRGGPVSSEGTSVSETDSDIARGACASPLTLRLGSAEDPQGAGPFCPGAPSQGGAWWEGACRRTGPSLPASARSLLTLHFFLATER